MTPEQLRAYHARKGRTAYDREYQRLHDDYSEPYLNEEIERSEGFVDRNEMPPGTFQQPRTHFTAGRFVHHKDGMVPFWHEDQQSKLPIKKERFVSKLEHQEGYDAKRLEAFERKSKELGSGINLTDAKRHEDYYHYAEGHAYSKRPEIKQERK